MADCKKETTEQAITLLAREYSVIAAEGGAGPSLRMELEFRMNELKSAMTPDSLEKDADWVLMVEGIESRNKLTNQERGNFNRFFNRLRSEQNLFTQEPTITEGIRVMELKREIVEMIRAEVAEEQGIAKG